MLREGLHGQFVGTALLQVAIDNAWLIVDENGYQVGLGAPQLFRGHLS